MLIVLVSGALVTKTESGKACGDTWPLCNGQFIPSFTIPQLIESGHRFITGIAGLLLLATVLLVFLYVKRKDAKWFAAFATISTILQSFLGALAALQEQSSIIMALHFGISLIAFASTFLIWLTFTRWGDYVSKAANGLLRMTGSFKTLVWISLAYTYIVVYVGAYVRHTDSSGGCLDWPLCNGQLIPELSGASGIMFMHRIAALLLVLVLVGLYVQARKHYRSSPLVYNSALLALVLVILQAFSGATVTWTLGNDWYLLTGIIHAIFIAGLFTTLCYLAVLTLYARKNSRL